jgi:pyruvate/2-oxoglutarate dehydrogenase complex dihydrolipoamide acyltransferase (E2) component
VIAGGFWSVFAPLESAAVGPGQVEAESFRKRIEHLAGGIIGQILAHDGDTVQPGQVLVRLDDTKAHTTLSGLRGQYWGRARRRGAAPRRAGRGCGDPFPRDTAPVAGFGCGTGHCRALSPTSNFTPPAASCSRATG